MIKFLFIGLVPILGVMFIVALFIMLYRGRSGHESQMNGEETRTIQEIHRGLERMEKRVEALESIILDRRENVPEAFDSKEGA